ncbi:MAG: hypothetical protein AB7S81_06935 [Bdellovibrionales bacterium]
MTHNQAITLPLAASDTFVSISMLNTSLVLVLILLVGVLPA